ncbi:MAG: nucleotidyltransferase family protein [Prevotella sp.]|nr:nucleotidyltransferase family protein [Prevotella sp.]
MHIITRNLLRLLRTGLFLQEETIEPMSAWKWQRMGQYAAMHDVTSLVYRGMAMSRSQFFANTTDTIDQQWRQRAQMLRDRQAQLWKALAPLTADLTALQLRPVLLGPLAMSLAYEMRADRQATAIDLFFPYETKAHKAEQWAWEHGTDTAMADHNTMTYTLNGIAVRHHRQLLPLSNALHARTLAAIVGDEFRESRPTFADIDHQRVELPQPTLLLLRQMLAVAEDVLSNGVHLGRLADIAVFLRREGHRVDFVKLQQWTERLRLGPMAQLQGNLLCSLLGLSADEVPFMDADAAFDPTPFADALFDRKGSSAEWQLRQATGDVFVSAVGSKAMLRQVRHSARHMRYYPTEGLAVLTAAFAHSLSDIEE